ncbi:MAG TPA: 3-dehydroquinate synthase [Chthoniobacterales bacterium]|nr:3-dehydroquinate synthase [Chthoniobacterales bacterium]
MSISNRRVTVSLTNRSYDVVIGAGMLERAGSLLREAGLNRPIAVITDERVEELYGQKLIASLAAAGFSSSLHVVSGGEPAKSFAMAEEVSESLAQAGVDRSSLVVALGGGVVGDLAGFVASIFARGIPYVQVPTTVMAQVDSSVGGKTAINLGAGKNLVGSFHQPALVIVDTETLTTLGVRERNEGLAEVIKYGVIADRSLLDAIEDLSQQKFAEIIERCVQIKANIVAEDEREESGKRALLNFGHTIGHAIESTAGYGKLLHGEAISLGMRAAGWLSAKYEGLPFGDYQRLIQLLRQLSLPVVLQDEIPTGAVMERVFADKKFHRGQIRFVLTSGFGSAFVSEKITRTDLESAVESLRESIA